MAFSLWLVLKRDSYFISKQATFVAVLFEELSNEEKKMNEFENNEVGKVTKIETICILQDSFRVLNKESQSRRTF